MWSIAVMAGLCCLVLMELLLLLKKSRSLQEQSARNNQFLQDQQKHWEDALSHANQENAALSHSLAQEKADAQALRTQLHSLTDRLAAQEAELARLQPRKLYLPDLEPEDPSLSWPQDPDRPFGDYTVYYNDRSGIYHTDRYCAPHLAAATHIFQVMDRARPCKKCAEGTFPTLPLAAPAAEEPGDDQLCLFDAP